MMKPLLNYLLILSCSLTLMLSSCGSGGMTLTGGDVNAIWMPNETYVNVNTGTIDVVYDSEGNPTSPFKSAKSVNAAVPQSIIVGRGDNGNGILSVDGVERSAKISYQQEGLTFTLAVETNDSQYRLFINNGVLESPDAVKASGNLVLQYQGLNGGYVAQSLNASLIKQS